MSTKIYNGYKINKRLSSVQLLSLMRELSLKMQEVAQDLYDKEVANLISLYLDKKLAFNEEVATNELLTTYHLDNDKEIVGLNHLLLELKNKDTKSNCILDDIFDFKCQVKLLPIEEGVLFLLYTNKNEFKEMLGCYDENEIETPSPLYDYITPYMYYNNVDKPEHLTEEEWDCRKEEWDLALGDYEQGFLFDLTHTPYTYSLNNVYKHMESNYERRINRLVEKKLADEFTNGLDTSIYDLSTFDGYITVKELLLKYKNTEEYKAKYNTYLEELKMIVPKTYVREDFKIKISAKTKEVD